MGSSSSVKKEQLKSSISYKYDKCNEQILQKIITYADKVNSIVPILDEYKLNPTMTNYTNIASSMMNFNSEENNDGLQKLKDILKEQSSMMIHGDLESLVNDPTIVERYDDEKLNETLILNMEYWKLLKYSKRELKSTLVPVRHNKRNIQIWYDIIANVKSMSDVSYANRGDINGFTQILQQWFTEDSKNILDLSEKWTTFLSNVKINANFWAKQARLLAQDQKAGKRLLEKTHWIHRFLGTYQHVGGCIFIGILLFSIIGIALHKYITSTAKVSEVVNENAKILKDLTVKTEAILVCMKGITKNATKMDMFFSNYSSDISDGKRLFKSVYSEPNFVTTNISSILGNLKVLQDGFSKLEKEFKTTIDVITESQKAYIDSI